MKTSNITANQKEQWLNKILNAHDLSLKKKNKKPANFLLSTYQKLQTLKEGQSLQIQDVIQIKQCFNNLKQKKRLQRKSKS